MVGLGVRVRVRVSLAGREMFIHTNRERICIELVKSDRKLKVSREGSKRRNYGT